MNPSLLIGLCFFVTLLAIFTGQVVAEGVRILMRRESRGFAFQRVENVYPKFKL